MAKQIDDGTVTIRFERQSDGTYTRTIIAAAGSHSDPVGSPSEKQGQTCKGVVAPTYSGAQTSDALVDAALAALKTSCGIV